MEEGIKNGKKEVYVMIKDDRRSMAQVKFY